MATTKTQATPCGCAAGCAACAKASEPTSSSTSGTGEATKRRGSTGAPCLPPRPRYFPGQLVSDADLSAGVDYDRAGLLLSNAVIGGWGVYSGYALTLDASRCSISVGPGVAQDAKGRALVNAGAVEILRPKLADIEGHDSSAPLDADLVLYLAAAYDDCLDAAKPRHGTPCGPDADPGCDFTRVKERVRFVWIREGALLPSSPYWTSGLLPCACAEPPQPDPREEYARGLDPSASAHEPPLDQCTPDYGLHGGVGVTTYADGLIQRWNLDRNAGAISGAGAARHGTSWPGIGSVLEVISSVSHEPSSGEALVVLARVTYSQRPGADLPPDPTDGGSTRGGRPTPTIHVEPMRRRVLSNVDLTYLLAWLMRRVLGGATPPGDVVLQEPPPPEILCEDPCVDQASFIKQLTRISVGDKASPAVQEAAMRELAKVVAVDRKTTLVAVGLEALKSVARGAFGGDWDPRMAADIERRYHQAAGVRQQLREARAALRSLFPQGFPEEQREWLEDRVVRLFRQSGAQSLREVDREAALDLYTETYQRVMGTKPTPSDLARVGALTRAPRRDDAYAELKRKNEEQAKRLAEVEAKLEALHVDITVDEDENTPSPGSPRAGDATAPAPKPTPKIP
jgi:hypothetical protein